MDLIQSCELAHKTTLAVAAPRTTARPGAGTRGTAQTGFWVGGSGGAGR